MATLLFYLFSRVALFAAFGVLLAKHPVHSVLYLVLVFCNAAGLLLLIEADVLALLFLVVYVGAIAVLFLFVVMMLDLKRRPLTSRQIIPILPAVRILVLIFLSELLLVLHKTRLKTFNFNILEYWDWKNYIDGFEPLQPLGQILYTHYVHYFLLGGLILLVALIGAIVLTLPTQSSDRNIKRQQIMHQISRREDSAKFLTNF